MKPTPRLTPVRCSAAADWRTLLPVCLRQAHRPPTTDATAGELLLRFTASARAVHNGFMRIFGPAGFTDHKFVVLVVLSALDPKPSTASQLATHADVTRASMTDVLEDLERRHWIHRQRDSEDRRIVRVRLRPAGKRVITAAAARFLEIAASLVGPLDSSDLAAFVRICGQLHDAGDDLPGRFGCLQIKS